MTLSMEVPHSPDPYLQHCQMSPGLPWTRTKPSLPLLSERIGSMMSMLHVLKLAQVVFDSLLNLDKHASMWLTCGNHISEFNHKEQMVRWTYAAE